MRRKAHSNGAALQAIQVDDAPELVGRSEEKLQWAVG
jgi:hypothetical protein